MNASSTPTTQPSPTLGREIRKVGQHSFVYMLAPAISKVVGFLLFPIYTSFISTEHFGINSLVEVVMTFAMLMMSVNIADALTRFYYASDDSRERRKVVSTAFLGMALLGFPVIGILSLSAGPIADFLHLAGRYVGLLRIGFFAAWFTLLSEIGFAYLRIRYMSKTFVSLTVVQILLTIGFNILFVVVYRLDIWGIMYSTVIVQGVLAVAMSMGILASTRTAPSWTTFRQLLRFGAPLMPSTVSQQLNNYIHPLMIQWLAAPTGLSAATQVGIFAAGQKIAVVVNRFMVVPFNGFWKPRRMELVLKPSEEVKRIVATMCTYATTLTSAFALLVSASSESVLQIMNDVGLISDPAYVHAHAVIPLIALAYAIHSLEHHFATGMHAAGKTRPALWIGLVALLATVATNWVLIPRFGYLAAALAAVVGATIRVGFFLSLSQSHMRLPFEYDRLACAIGVAIVLYLLIPWIQFESQWTTLLARVAVAAGYLPLLATIGFLSKAERNKLREVLARSKRHSCSQQSAT